MILKHKFKYYPLIDIRFVFLFLVVFFTFSTAFAQSEDCEDCTCESGCGDVIGQVQANVDGSIEFEFEKLRQWIVNSFFYEEGAPFGQPLYALALMTNQLTAVGIQQVEIIGTFFDAKHQLETQRLFQTLIAEAHKDYHPSEGLCVIGSATRSLSTSERRADLTQLAYANRMMQRQLLSRHNVSGLGEANDRENRLRQFISTYCRPSDNSGPKSEGEDVVNVPGLELLCGAGGVKSQLNMDIDFSSTLESKLTLDMDLIENEGFTPDQQNIFALSANIFGHEVLSAVADRLLADGRGNIRELFNYYVRQRSVAAKRSVAQNSFSALVGMRTSGNEESAPFVKAVMEELGVAPREIDLYLGDTPSYFAQMEVLTKKLYQSPQFYADLYDKPVNIERKGVAMQAIGIMQDRDIYDSLLRSEAVLATLVETLMMEEHDRVSRDIADIETKGEKYIEP